MKDIKITIYDELYIHLFGDITNGCLHLESAVYGDDYDSEKHYSFSKEETERLFSIISLEDFILLCREKRLIGMEAFLKRNNISFKTHCF